MMPVDNVREPKHAMAAPTVLKVLVVDDSVVIRRLLSRLLSEDPSIEVIGSARDGVDALAKIDKLQPDLVTLDVEMPELDGLSTLRLIGERHPHVRVVMCSNLTAKGAAVTIDALLSGASDYVTKRVDGDGSLSPIETLGRDLRSTINKIFGVPSRNTARDEGCVGNVRPAPRRSSVERPGILAIGVSTGGPAALAELLPRFPRDFPLPIVIVQHMPAQFTKLLAERLDQLSEITVQEATAGAELRPGCALIAPGDFHMTLSRTRGTVRVELNQDERENSCRPAVDVLFRSVADTYGGAVLATVLTGMGQDGLSGVQQLKRRGACVLAQDAATSVIWGMPGAIVGARLADAVVPLTGMAQEIMRRL